MTLPELLQKAIESVFERVSLATLKKARSALREDYLEGKVSAFENEEKRLAYLGSRMPATFAAIRKVIAPLSLSGHLLDLGAGLGAASWAALDLFSNIEKVTLVERSKEAIGLGKMLAREHPLLKDSLWLKQSLEEPLPQGDAAILSYVIGELKNPQEIVTRCFESVSTLILIEPGTPKAFLRMKKIREHLLSLGAFVVAPCPHAKACPHDWCHFSARLERSSFHRQMKEGSLGYEDEKFCYLVVSKVKHPFHGERIVEKPFKGKGFVRFCLCTKEGHLEEQTISRKEKELYHKLKKAEWGDLVYTDPQK